MPRRGPEDAMGTCPWTSLGPMALSSSCTVWAVNWRLLKCTQGESYQRVKQNCSHSDPATPLKANCCHREGDGENQKGERGPGGKWGIKEKCGGQAWPSGTLTGPPGKKMKVTRICKDAIPRGALQGEASHRLCPGPLPGAVNPGRACEVTL